MRSTSRFGPRAKAYAAFRPSYPPSAIDAVLAGLGEPDALIVADVGAGTGISARLIAQRGARVIAIEPNARMRAAAEGHASVTWHHGTAERTGLASQSVDVALACEAFHWFATMETMAEFRRIARKRAALLQYERDERDPFTAAYGELVRSYATDDTEAIRQEALAVFAAFPGARVRRTDHPVAQRLDRPGLLGRAASASYLPAVGPPAQRLRADLEALFERYERDGVVELAMVTFALVADW
ncbi:MAG: methyltransferase domain-containing protein [Candidatus Eremiobacteraeota bacterium]|nr:methyltransferase domain-containing protein [Candidatus Eremiobacteraeota bacterium]